jgi:hypothetical protein
MTGSGPVSVVILFARKCKPNSAPPYSDTIEVVSAW